MKIDKVTITGADDKTPLSDLVSLHAVYPFVEWAILFSKNKTGTPRYPQLTNAISFAQKSMPMSAHLCGEYARDVMENSDFRFIATLPDAYQRVQINYNFSRNQQWNIPRLIDHAERNPERAIILQWNKANAAELTGFINTFPPNIQFLYDSSGGRGISIKNIQDPLPNYTGYSGGIHPGNIEEIVKQIEMHESSKTVWVDMESGVRTENNFDIEKVENVLHICSRHICE